MEKTAGTRVSIDEPKRKYLAVTNWDELQYHKQLSNPPWTRLHQHWLNDYGFGQQSLACWGVFFGMHMLAARTGNKIPYDVGWIAKQFSKRPSPVGKVIRKLIVTGFLLEFEQSLNSKENRELSFVSSVDTTLPDTEQNRSDRDATSLGRPDKPSGSGRPQTSAEVFEELHDKLTSASGT